MGFHLRGIATSLKTENIKEFISLLDIDVPIVFDTESFISDFECATSIKSGKSEVFLTETRNGSMLTVWGNFPLMETYIDKICTSGKVMKFSIDETAMKFAFEFYENGRPVRECIVNNGQVIIEEGEPLSLEKVQTDYTEIIFQLIGVITGDHFYKIEPDRKSIGCKYSKP